MTIRNADLAAAIVAACVCAAAAADPVTYTFENLPLNTAVTAQYFGVTFSVAGQSCAGSPTLYMRIKTPTGNTSSGTRALQIDTGCPDFSPDYLRMVFDNAQSEVSFTVGDLAATYVVRAYSTTSGAGLLSTQNISVPGAGFVGVHRVVHVLSDSTNIRRIEIETSPSGLFETIDDLTFDPDSTPPTAIITAPSANDCDCSPVQIRGTANDADGTYARDRAEYRPAGSTVWTLIGTAGTPATNSLLYNWDTSGLAEGLYFIRLTVENTTGLSSTAETTVWVSQDVDKVEFSLPSIVGGTVCPSGTVFDNWCDIDFYTVGFRPAGLGAYVPVDSGTPQYAGSRINQTLAAWNTLSPMVPDGAYQLRVEGTNPCGHSKSLVSPVFIVDNTAPIAVISTPSPCAALGPVNAVIVRGTANDAHLASWRLFYTGGDANGWVPITPPEGSPVIDDTLATWNTTGLRRCAYTLRLVVSDLAVVNCNGVIHNTSEYTVSVDLGCDADFNRSGLVSVQDIFDFLAAYFAGCP